MIRALIKAEHNAGTIDVLLKRTSEILREFNGSTENHEELKAFARKHTADHVSAHVVEDWRLKQILDGLRDREIITDTQAEAFLCTVAPSESLKNFQGLVLLSALEHQSLFGDRARPLRAMAAYRLLVEDQQKKKNRLSSILVENILPETSQSLEGIVEAIESALEAPHNRGDNYIERRLGPVRRILGDLIEKRLENKRNRHNFSKVKIADQNQNEEDFDDENVADSEPEKLYFRQVSGTEDVPAYQEIVVQPARHHKKQDASEYVADNQASGLFITMLPESDIPASFRTSMIFSAMHAKAVSGNIERREKRLMCLTNRLSKRDVKILVAELQNRMHACDVSYLIYLVLATGRRPDALFSAKRVRGYKSFDGFGNAYSIDAQDILWMYRHQLPAHRVSGRQRVLLDQQQAPVVLPVPCPVRKREIPIMCRNEFAQRANELLKEINASNSTRFSIPKIADHLTNFLHDHGVDDVIIALITGNPNLQEAGLYYSQYDTVSLYRHYQQYRQDELQAKTLDPVASNAAFGGSQLIATDSAVVGIFDHLKQNLRQAQGSNWVEVHNSFVMYTLHFLYLATGHRPVRDPFDDINSIDLANKRIFISDKESRFAASSARTLVLSEVAITQIKHYKNHLEIIHIHMQSLLPSFAKEVEESLDGQRPLLFLIRRGPSVNQIKMDFVSPGRVAAFWGDLLSLPSNWYRHFLRTYLMRQETVAGEAVDTWMGHASPGQEGFTRYSGMSIRALEGIAYRIDILFANLKISPLTSKGLADE